MKGVEDIQHAWPSVSIGIHPHQTIKSRVYTERCGAPGAITKIIAFTLNTFCKPRGPLSQCKTLLGTFESSRKLKPRRQDMVMMGGVVMRALGAHPPSRIKSPRIGRKREIFRTDSFVVIGPKQDGF